MNYLILLLLLFGCVDLIASEDQNVIRKCDYRETVDLTNQTNYENGSYVYQNVLIPVKKQDVYEYKYFFNYKKRPVPRHLRGCVCTKEKSCIKLCCEQNEFFNSSSFKCESLSDSVVSWNLTIQLENGENNQVNILDNFIYQVGLPCKMPEALIADLDQWILLENGYLYIGNDKSKLDTVNYCFTPYYFNISDEYSLVPLSCPIANVITWKMLLNTYAMVISVLFLIPTIVVYLMFKELRGNLRGKLLICYLISMTVGYGIISFINVSQLIFDYLTCSLLGFTCYFFLMSAFLWLSVLCYDIWNNFRETSMDLNLRKNNQKFIYYSLYAWGLAYICTLLCIWSELSPKIKNIYKPGIGDSMCWLNTDKWSATIYFYGPNLIIVIFNFVTFTLLTKRIYKVRRALAKLTQQDRVCQDNAVVVLRLFLIMGISWLFDILSYGLRYCKNVEFIFVLSDLGNAIQGLLIFSLFVMKPNVLNLLRNKFQNNNRIVKPRRSVTSSTTNISKLQISTSVTQPLVGQHTP